MSYRETYIVLFLILSPSYVLGQTTIKKNYYVSVDKEYNKLGKDYFYLDGSSFEMIKITNRGWEYGKGSYVIKNDSIYFQFVDIPQKKNYTIKRIKQPTDSNNIVMVKVNYDKELLAGVNLVLKELKIGVVSKQDGKAVLKVPPSFEDTLVVSLLGFRDEFIPLNKRKNQSLEVLVELKYGYFIYSSASDLKYKVRIYKHGFSWVFHREVMFEPVKKRVYKRGFKKFGKFVKSLR